MKDGTKNGKYNTAVKAGDKRIQKSVIAWLLSFAAANVSSNDNFAMPEPVVIGLIILSIILGLVVAWTLVDVMRSWDDLDKLVYYKASAITVALCLMFFNSYDLILKSMLPHIEQKAAHLVVIMCVTFMISLIYQKRQYQWKID